jgi:hypothetical protein
LSTPQQQANELIKQANALSQAKQYDQAIALYQQAMALVPDSPVYQEYNFVIGDLLFKTQRYEAAAQAYRACVAVTPKVDQAWAGLGQCLMLLGKDAEAADAFERCLEANGRSELALYYGAMVSAKLERSERARDYLGRLLSLKPEWEKPARADPLLKGYLDERPWWQFGRQPAYRPPVKRVPASWQTFSTSTSLLFTLSLMSICIGLTAAVGFVGQCTLELPYHLYGKEATATVGNRWVDEDNTGPLPVRSAGITVYYFVGDESARHLVASRLRGVERLAHDNLEAGSHISVVYVPGNTDEVMPKEVLGRARAEIRSGLLGGLAIALPGIGLLVWLKRTRRLG